MDVEQPHNTAIRSFNVESEVYSGPLDLLIDLIEKRKLLVNDISLASVTDAYMEYVAQFEQNPQGECQGQREWPGPLREMADFIVLASTLLLLKSKSLLPILELTETEEESIQNLEERLRYYQIFRNVAKTIETIFGKNTSYERPFVPSKQALFVTDKYTTTSALRDSMAEVVRNLPIKKEKPKVQVKTVISLETMIERLRDRIEKQLTFKFRDFTGDSGERTTIIVGFLAVLEMVKQGSLIVRQSVRFHDIEIEREMSTAPRYR